MHSHDLIGQTTFAEGFPSTISFFELHLFSLSVLHTLYLPVSIHLSMFQFAYRYSVCLILFICLSACFLIFIQRVSFSIDVHLSIFNLIDIFFVSLLRTSKLSVYIHVHMFIFLLIDIFFVLSFILHTSMFLSILICLYFNLNIARSHLFRITFYSFHFRV